MKKINTLILLSLIVFGTATSAFAMSESSTECADGNGVSRAHVDSSDSGNTNQPVSNNGGDGSGE